MSIQEIVPFNFDEMYQSISQKFSDLGYDTAQGSNTSQLSTVMAYTTSMLNANTAININETILPYARNRPNIINNARNFGYEIQHKTSYVYNVTLELEEGLFVLPKFTPFTYKSKIYYYLGRQIEVDVPQGGQSLTIQVKEGILNRYEQNRDSLYVTIGEIEENGVKIPRYYIDVPFLDVEENGIEVYCSYFDEYSIFHEKEEWTKAPSTYLEVDGELKNQFIRIDNIEYGTPRLYFRYAGMGDGLKLGSEVFINVLQSSGSKGEIDDLNPENLKLDLIKCKVTKIELVSEGADEEPSDNIKENAPKLYNSANRLVIANDYISACKRDTRIRNCIVWGGEDEFPKAPGHIWFTFLPVVDRTFKNDEGRMFYEREYCDFTYDYATIEDQSEKLDEYYNHNYVRTQVIRSTDKLPDGTILNPGIWDKIDSLRIPTLVYHNRHPIFCQFEYTISIMKYFVTENKQETHDAIFNIIDDFFIGDNDSIKMENFDTEYFNSSLIKRIDKHITDISGFEMSVDTKLILNEKTLALENPEPEYRDIYIPLALPYERYFDDEGYLLIDKLPNIDTLGLVAYNEKLGDLYVDWSLIRKDIEEKKVKQKRHKLIIAPVRIRYRQTYHFKEHDGTRKVVLKFRVYPDDVDQNETADYTFNNVKIYLRKDGVEPSESDLLPHNQNNGWIYDIEKPNQINFGGLVEIGENDYIEVEANPMCGFYYLFNSYTKEILVHLFVDGTVSGYKDSLGEDFNGENYPQGDLYESYLYSYDDRYLYSSNDNYLVTEALLTGDTSYSDTIYTQPRSYLTTTDNRYLYTTDGYYLTTNGYALTDEDQENSYTGPIIKVINKHMYLRSGLKMDLFYNIRYLNLDYATPNFKVIRNVIPYLRSVKFIDLVN